MSNRSLAETLFFVNLLFINRLSVRACSGVHDRVRGCFGGVRVMFRLCSGYVRALNLSLFGVCVQKQNKVYRICPAHRWFC